MQSEKEAHLFAQTLLALYETKALNDSNFFNDLKTYLSKVSDETLQNNAKEVLNTFVTDFQKHHSENISIPKELTSQRGRLYMDGVFDMVHSGHFNALRQAKLLGDILVVGVVCNKEVEYHKGPPVMSFEERAEIVGACKWVDEIASGDIPYNPTIDLIDRLNCQWVAHGDDLALSADGTDSYSIIRKAGRMKTFKRTQGISTTDIVGRLLLLTKNPQRNEAKMLRKISGDNLVTSQNMNNIVEESKEESKPEFQLLQTTRRIRQFSTGREVRPDDKVVYVDGSFDLLHVGHVRFLKKAKEFGTYLLVGIHSDDTVERRKGSGYPVLHLQERVLNILALKVVDEVIIGAPDVVSEQLLKNFNVSTVVEGSVDAFYEKEAQTITENDIYAVPKKQGIFKKVTVDCKVTTATLIDRILENRKKLAEVQAIKKKKLENYYKSHDQTIQES